LSKSRSDGRHPQKMNSWSSNTARAHAQSNLRFSPSQHSGTDDHVPEERSNKSHHNNAKDQTPRVEAEGLVVVGGQPVGIAHAKLLRRPPASPLRQILIKIS